MPRKRRRPPQAPPPLDPPAAPQEVELVHLLVQMVPSVTTEQWAAYAAHPEDPVSRLMLAARAIVCNYWD